MTRQEIVFLVTMAVASCLIYLVEFGAWFG
jgi:hypothetical protein